MYTLVKMFDKAAIPAGETITKFWFDQSGQVFAVETDKAMYQLVKA